MTLAQKIREKIESIPEELTFGYAELDIAKKDYQTAAKVLERLLKDGSIRKASKGVFYKPQKTIFGEIGPDYDELLRPYLFKNGKRIAYITGEHLYNQLNLTTQMAFRIKIASRSKRITINRGAIKATPVKSYAEVTHENYQLLGFLDALKDIKKISDSDVKTSVAILSGRIKKLDKKKIAEMTEYALLYPPRVRALLGAILENIKADADADVKKLKEGLNPLTKFDLGLKPKDLPTAPDWNIV